MARAKAAVTTIKRGLKHLLRPAVRGALLPVIVACVLAASQARHRCWLILNTFLLHRLRNGEDLPDIAGGDADEDEDGAEDKSSYASPLFTLVRQVLMLGHPKANPITPVPGLHDWYANTFLPAHGDQGPLAFREDPVDQIAELYNGQADEYATSIRSFLTRQFKSHLLLMCKAFVAAERLGWRVRLLPRTGPRRDPSGRCVVFWHRPEAPVAAGFPAGKGASGWGKHLMVPYPAGSAKAGEEHTPSHDPLLVAKMLQAAIVGRVWQEGERYASRKAFLLTEAQAGFVRAVRELLGNPARDAMVVEWPDPATGVLLRKVSEKSWAGQHLQESLEVSYVALQMAEYLNKKILPRGYPAGPLPTFDIIPRAYIKRYPINMFTMVTAQIIHKAKDNAEGGKDADLRAAMRRLNCPKPSAFKTAGLTDQKKVNLFGRVFDYTQIFDPRRRPLAYTSLRTDGVLAYVPFGKRGAARAHRGQGARGRGGGGGGSSSDSDRGDAPSGPGRRQRAGGGRGGGGPGPSGGGGGAAGEGYTAELAPRGLPRF